VNLATSVVVMDDEARSGGLFRFRRSRRDHLDADLRDGV